MENLDINILINDIKNRISNLDTEYNDLNKETDIIIKEKNSNLNNHFNKMTLLANRRDDLKRMLITLVDEYYS